MILTRTSHAIIRGYLDTGHEEHCRVKNDSVVKQMVDTGVDPDLILKVQAEISAAYVKGAQEAIDSLKYL